MSEKYVIKLETIVQSQSYHKCKRMEDHPGVSIHSGGSIICVVDKLCDFITQKLDQFVACVPPQYKDSHNELHSIAPENWSPSDLK